MSVARLFAEQRIKHAVPHAFTCRVLKVRQSWFYKWIKDPTTVRAKRRAELDEAVRVAFGASERAHGSPRLDLTEPEPAQDGTTPLAWRVGENTVADSTRRQGLVARVIRRRCGLTRQDKTAPKFPDLLKRDFTAKTLNQRWVGDMKQIMTGEGKLYLGTVIDRCSRRALAVATSTNPNAQLACDAIKMAVAVRGGADHIAGVVFHTDRGSTGGLNRSSQHLTITEVSDGAKATTSGPGSSAVDAVTWSTDPRQARGARVLAPDCEGQVQRRRCARSRCVGAGRSALVSSRWRHDALEPG